MGRTYRAALLVIGAAVLWVFLDLYLRSDLPLASEALHLAFRSAAAAVAWMEEGDGFRPRRVLVTIVAVTGVALALGRRAVWFWRFAALPVVLVQLALIVVAALMERGLAVGIAVGVALIATRLPAEEGGDGARWGRVLLALAAAGSAGLYLAEMLAARSDGYPLVEWLATQAVEGTPLAAGWMAFCALVGILCALAVRRHAWVALPAVVVALVGGLLLDAWLPVLSALAVAGGGTLLLAAAWPTLVSGPGDRRWDTATWPARLAPFVLVGWLLVGHTYAVRVLGCSAVQDRPELTRLGQPGEVFRAAIRDDGRVAALAVRPERRIGRLDLRPDRSEITYADPGALPAFEPHDRDFEGQSLASIEELLWAPGADRFFGTALGGHPDFYSLPSSPSNVVHNTIFEMGPDARRVTRSVGIEHLCWIGAMAWREADERLYLGCEYEPVLHRYDPATGSIETTNRDEGLGDVAALAVDPENDRLFTVAFWSSQAVAEVDPKTLTVVRRRDVGGAHYDIAFDPASDRVFLSSYYGSRVRVLRASDLGREGRIATGFGARALAVDPARDLVLASSVYDGVIRACSASTGRGIADIRVGGHVKDITVDSERGVAVFWSRCGLFELDLEALVSESRSE